MSLNGTTVTPVLNVFGNTGAAADDAVWTLLCAFLIFSMQSGFALLESGMVSAKNEVNIVAKNVIDVVVGGIAFWVYGFGFAYGDKAGTNGFTGVGYFFTDISIGHGYMFTKFAFQLPFANTATTIVSGAMAERVYFPAYMLFSCTNILSYCFPAHWIWGGGWLANIGTIDIAGSCVVHMVGGAAAFAAAYVLGPRTGRYDNDYERPQLASPNNVLFGTFMLWWGWLAFNCGSTWGVGGDKWMLAGRAAGVTMLGAAGGGLYSLIYCYLIRSAKFEGKLDIPILSAGILSGLVSITAICAITSPWEGFIIGIIGGAAGIAGIELMDIIKVDDPVGCIGVHWFAGAWGMLAVAFFAEEDKISGLSPDGIFRGGKAKYLGAQLAAIVCVTLWAVTVSFIQLIVYQKLFGVRMSAEDEQAGADFIEHGIAHQNVNESGTNPFGGRRPISHNVNVDEVIINNTAPYFEEAEADLDAAQDIEMAEVNDNQEKTENSRL